MLMILNIFIFGLVGKYFVVVVDMDSDGVMLVVSFIFGLCVVNGFIV